MSKMDQGYIFPESFLWGAATAAHQVEGNNINSESWVLEHLPGTAYAEPSADAIDHYHRYPADIALLADLGFNAYCFSVEWARIEPEQDEFSYAELEHYRRMLATRQEHGLKPVVTFHHFTSPRWLIRWRLAEQKRLNALPLLRKVTRHLGDDSCRLYCQRAEPANVARKAVAVQIRRTGLVEDCRQDGYGCL
jgi:beta-glucosidase